MLQDSGDAEDQERLANIEELITAAQQFHAEDNSRTIGDFLENITLASDVDGWDEKQDCVAVMTLHAAKGLEFPVVYMLAIEQGILPHERSLSKRRGTGGRTPAGLRRHDAGQGGTVSLRYARMREFRGQTLYAVPSMFLDELPAEGIERNRSVVEQRQQRARSITGAAAPRRRAQGWYDTGFAKTVDEDARRTDAASASADGLRVGAAGASRRLRRRPNHRCQRPGRRCASSRFASRPASDKFLAAKAKLAIVQKG